MARRAPMWKFPSLLATLRCLRPVAPLTVPPSPALFRRFSAPPAPPAPPAPCAMRNPVQADARWWHPELSMDHWLVHMDLPEDTHLKLGRDEIVDIYVKTLAQVLGSEEEARAKIYSTSLKHVFCFGARVSFEIADQIERLPNVDVTTPDCYVDEDNHVFGILDIACKDEDWDRNGSRKPGNEMADRMICYIRSLNKYDRKITLRRGRC